MNTCKVVAYGCGLLMSFSTLAVEFNLNVLDKSMIISQIPIRDKTHLFEYLHEIERKKGEGVAVCIPTDLAEQLGLKEKILRSLPMQNNCVDFTAYADIAFTLDIANQHLDISIPQVLMAWKSESWMPPSTWDHGVNGLLFDYNLFASTYRPDQGASTENINSYGTSGLNMGAWRSLHWVPNSRWARRI